MKKQFKDINVDEKFKLNNIEYIKIDPIKVSCCRSLNAQLSNDANNKTFVQPLEEVDVDDQL